MTARKTSAVQRRKTKRLKVKRETLKDLDTRARGEKVKGGVKDPTMACNR
jgi:hypothetical protein